MPTEQADIVVLGGGPAGSTFAGIVKKYSPETKLILLEKEHFPRWHIGESTIPVANGVFRDLEIYETLLQANFIKKMGVTFIWGQDRAPWTADYLTLQTITSQIGESDIIDVTGQDLTQLGQDSEQPEPFTAFNVCRAEFDNLLLNQARKFGADVREGTAATKVLRNEQEYVKAVSWRNDQGETGQIETPFVLDATGLSHLMTRGEREYDQNLNNFAVYGYLSGADWKVTYNGTRDRSAVFIAAVDQGWIWYFPLREDVISVGAVTNTQHFKQRLKNVAHESFFWEMLHSCPEISGLIKQATLRTDILPNQRRVGVSRDWSSWAKQPVGKGWATVGDAAVFVDPILSTGLTLALQTGHRAAYTYLTAQARPDLSSESLWRAYGDYLRGESGSFLTLARYFYRNNQVNSSGWWEAQKLVNASGKLNLDSQSAFTMASAGFFPIPRVFGQRAEVVAPMLQHLGGASANLLDIYQNSGIPDQHQLIHYQYQILSRFKLDMRTEPKLDSDPTGQLEIYYDLVPIEVGFYHRTAAVPTQINPCLTPLVKAMQTTNSVAEIVTQAVSLLFPQIKDANAIEQAALGLVRIAAMKGFIRLSDPVPPLGNDSTTETVKR